MTDKSWGVIFSLLTNVPQSQWMRVFLFLQGDSHRIQWFLCWPDKIHWIAWFLTKEKRAQSNISLALKSVWRWRGDSGSVLQQTAGHSPDILMGLWMHGWILWTLSFLSTWSSGERSKNVNITSDLEYCCCCQNISHLAKSFYLIIINKQKRTLYITPLYKNTDLEWHVDCILQ